MEKCRVVGHGVLLFLGQKCYLELFFCDAQICQWLRLLHLATTACLLGIGHTTAPRYQSPERVSPGLAGGGGLGLLGKVE